MSQKSQTLKDLYSKPLKDLRKYCIKRKLPGINSKSPRDECLKAILKTNTKSPLLRKSNTLSANKKRHSFTKSLQVSNRNPQNKINNNSRRSRKRRRQEFDNDNHNNNKNNNKSPSIMKQTKRRKTSVITTPERSASGTTTGSGRPLANYKSNHFLNLLNDSSDDDDDNDDDMPDVQNNNNNNKQKSASIQILNNNNKKNNNKNKNKNKATLPSELLPTTSALETLKESSDDDDGDSEIDGDDHDGDGTSSDDTEYSPIHKPIQYNNNKKLNQSKTNSNSLLNSNSRRNTNNNNVFYSPINTSLPHNISYKQTQQSPLPCPLPSINTNRFISSSPVNTKASPIIPKKKKKPNISSNNRVKVKVKKHPVNKCKRIVSIIFYPFIKLYNIIAYLFSNPMILSIIIVILIFLPSPVFKLIFEYYPIFVMNISSLINYKRIIYCDNDIDSSDIRLLNHSCILCPLSATCYGGDVYCTNEKILVLGECVYDKNQLVTIRRDMELNTQLLLRQRCGEYQCQSYWLYNYIMDIELIPNNEIKHDELSDILSRKVQLLRTSNLFQKVFYEFTDDIKKKKDRNNLNILYNFENNSYSTNKSIKPILCHLNIFLYKYCFILIIIFICGCIYIRYKINQNHSLNKIRFIKQKKDDIIGILKDYMMNHKTKWVSIEIIKNRMMGENENGWNKIEKYVDRDPNVQKSAQMIDGVQRLCWKLSDAALLH